MKHTPHKPTPGLRTGVEERASACVCVLSFFGATPRLELRQSGDVVIENREVWVLPSEFFQHWSLITKIYDVNFIRIKSF